MSADVGAMSDWRGVIERYRDLLPVGPKTPVVSLNEGNTPLVPAPALSALVGAEVRLKFEGMNPTGSFKDRGMTLAITKAKEEGARVVLCASTGNTSASAAAYAARAGIRCVVLIPKGAIALGKLSQALIHGAQVIAIRGNFDRALEIVRDIAAKKAGSVTLVNSVNPFRLEGQKTGAFEICDQWGGAPDFHAIPVGNAGNISAYWKGYGEYYSRSIVRSRPVMLGFQAAGAAPIVKGRAVKDPKTVATAIRIGNPASWKLAVAAADESGGSISTVTDAEILAAYKFLAAKEGVFAEPASAAGVAGVIKLSKAGFFRKASGKRVVCVLTGHGLKDPDRAIASVRVPAPVAAELDPIVRAMKL